MTPPDSNLEPPRVWQRMLSGRRLDLVNPSPEDIEIEDIAHGLARVARWNGQTIGDHALSVAQHSLIVEEIFTTQFGETLARGQCRRWQLAALLHDAPEYVIGDMISPFKSVLGLDYQKFEERLQKAVHLRFSLMPVLPHDIKKAIKAADRISAYFEATRLAGFDLTEAGKFFGQPTGLPAHLSGRLERLVAWPAPRAQYSFLQRFSNLTTLAR